MCIYFYCLGSVWGLGGVDSYYSFQISDFVFLFSVFRFHISDLRVETWVWHPAAGGTDLGAASWGNWAGSWELGVCHATAILGGYNGFSQLHLLV